MTEIIDITFSSSPPAPSPARTRRPACNGQLDAQQRSSATDELLYRQSCDVDLLSDGEPDVMLSSAANMKQKAGLSRHSPLTKPRSTALGARSRPSAQFDDSFFDSFDEPEFPIEQPAKRRRFSPPVLKSAASDALGSVNKVFDLSSEPDIPPKTSTQLLSGGTNITICDVKDDNDYGLLPSFSSSAPEPRQNTHTAKMNDLIEILSDEDALADDPIMSSSQPPKTSKAAAWSDRTSSVLANITQTNNRSRPRPRLASITAVSMLKQSKPRPIAKVKLGDHDNIIDSSEPEVLSRSPVQRRNAYNKTKAPNKPRKTTAEKEAEQEQKRLAKERQAAEKQLAADKAEVNKRKTDRKKSAEEMLLYMPSALRDKPLGNQVEVYMKEVNIKVSFYEDEIDMTRDDAKIKSLGKAIKWKREIKSTYDDIKEEWVPLARTKVLWERHILVYLTGEEFCMIAATNTYGQSSGNANGHPPEKMMKENLDTYIMMLGSRHPGCTIILLIEGLASYIKRIANAKNREFQASVRGQQVDLEDPRAPPSSTQPASSSRAPRKHKQNKQTTDLSFFNTDIGEVLQLHLQLAHQGLQIHHTTSVATSAKQIDSFTQHLSTRPYRQIELDRNLAHASFCMASGQFRTGQGDATETFIKMLEQVNRLTVSMAHGIVDAGYNSPAKLVEGFKKAEKSVSGADRILGADTSLEREGREKAKLMLEDVKKAANKDGAWNNQRLGPQISKRLWKVFMSNDEDMRDGIA